MARKAARKAPAEPPTLKLRPAEAPDDGQGPFCYKYPRPAVTVDLVPFALDGTSLKVLLVKRKHEPFEGHWAIPGGFLEIDEPAAEGAARELHEETGVEFRGLMYEAGFAAAVDRDPRGRTISLVHVGLIPPPLDEPMGADDAADARWFDVLQLEEPLAFDHAIIIDGAFESVQESFDNVCRVFALLPDPFAVDDVKALFRALGRPLYAVKPWLEDAESTGTILRLPGRKAMYRELREILFDAADGDFEALEKLFSDEEPPAPKPRKKKR